MGPQIAHAVPGDAPIGGRADDSYDDPYRGGNEACDSGAPDSVGLIRVLVGPFEFRIDEP